MAVEEADQPQVAPLIENALTNKQRRRGPLETRWPANSFLRDRPWSHATLRAFVAFFGAMRDFFGTAAAVFLGSASWISRKNETIR
jgi:hypothetical protein